MPKRRGSDPGRRSSSSPARSTHRCAIYTRKSSEEGLEQEFNSLDAQREACEAYIRSQKQAGWVALPDMYDDGGVSGGTMERPALQRLLADIGAGRVDTVVVYKVDRLTRSLADFAKIVEAFDAKGVAFVSVTQQFNTTSSMGRLTLNMLLSFAQFEREVTGERIRDKIAASKQKGMWMGGYPPLGYDVADRKLVINEAEAATVRHIFQRCAELKSVRALKEELDAAGIVSKVRSGGRGGARPIERGALYHMLQNRLYRGDITHKGLAYPGQHEAIVQPELWNLVQSALVENRVGRARGGAASAPSLLTGLLFDGAGERMSPSHASKQGRRYRYYISRSLIQQSRSQAPAEACRVPAADLETIVERRICELLQDAPSVHDLTRAALSDAKSQRALLAAAAELGAALTSRSAAERRAMLQAIIGRITVHADTVEIEVGLGALVALVTPARSQSPGSAIDLPSTLLTVSAQLKRTGLDNKLLVDAAPTRSREPDRSLVRLLAQAHRFWDLSKTAQGREMHELAREVGVTPSYFARMLRLAFLAPSITHAILQGRQPADLTANRLKNAGIVPTSWSEQQVQFGLT